MNRSKSAKRILNEEQYAKSEAWLKEAAERLEHPLCPPEEQERLYKIFEATTLLMGDYVLAKECREDDKLKAFRIASGRVTQEWLDEYWVAMDGKQPDPEKEEDPPTDASTLEPESEPVEEEQPKPAAAALASWLDED